MKQAVIVGDALWDAVVSSPDAPPVLYPGGAGLNLTVGLSRFGMRAALAARVGFDQIGARLRRYMLEQGVDLIETPNTDFTDVVTSTRDNGEPTYYFSPQLYRRRIHFGAELKERVATAAVVASNSFPFGDLGQSTQLARLLAEAPGLTVLDPNPRPRLIRDVRSYRQGVEDVAGSTVLVKMSSEDASILYPGGEAEAIASMFARGVRAIVFTRGERGASVFGCDGLRADVGIASGDGPVIDTMGAGDATLASIVSTIAIRGFPQDVGDWCMVLERAMRVAAATCRSPGGEIVVPDDGAAA